MACPAWVVPLRIASRPIAARVPDTQGALWALSPRSPCRRNCRWRGCTGCRPFPEICRSARSCAPRRPGSGAAPSRLLRFEKNRPCRPRAPARSASSISFRNSEFLMELDVLVPHGEIVDAAVGRRDPAGHLARLDHLLHQRMHEGAVGLRGNPGMELFLVLLLGKHFPLRIHRLARPGADGAAEARRGQGEAEREAGALDLAVP